VVTVPLILLAIPSALIGFVTLGPLLFGDFFNGVIIVADSHRAMAELAAEFHGPLAMVLHSVGTVPFWLTLAGVALTYYCYLVNPRVPEALKNRFSGLYTLLENKYFLDKFNQVVIARGAYLLGMGLWNVGDRDLIDGLAVNGSARVIDWFARITRIWQTGFIYHYAFVMIIGVLGFLIYFMPFPFAR
jgi:NADH-quinone oxidoreductase subunit L